MEFLLIAVVVATVGIAIVLWRNRGPRGVHGHVTDFQRGIRALAPEQEMRPPRRHGPEPRSERGR
ncbi:MAG: hypothetical protein ACRDWD_13730 [Acidimicrobiia bacterium]